MFLVLQPQIQYSGSSLEMTSQKILYMLYDSKQHIKRKINTYVGDLKTQQTS